MDLYRSLEFVSVLWAYYCLFGFFLHAGFAPEKPLAVCMVISCAIVSGYGLYQYFWGFDQLYSYHHLRRFRSGREGSGLGAHRLTPRVFNPGFAGNAVGFSDHRSAISRGSSGDEQPMG